MVKMKLCKATCEFIVEWTYWAVVGIGEWQVALIGHDHMQAFVRELWCDLAFCEKLNFYALTCLNIMTPRRHQSCAPQHIFRFRLFRAAVVYGSGGHWTRQRSLVVLHGLRICVYCWEIFAVKESAHRVCGLPWGHLCPLGIHSIGRLVRLSVPATMWPSHLCFAMDVTSSKLRRWIGTAHAN